MSSQGPAKRRKLDHLFFACRDGNVSRARALLDAGVDVNQAEEDGETPLWVASDRGHAEVVRLLLQAPGIDVNQANYYGGATPLRAASQEGHVEVVKLFLAAPGIDVNKAGWGRTPLDVASWNGHDEVVKLLLQAPGIDVNQANYYGYTPLYVASQKCHAEVVKLLLAAPGIDVNQADINGATPLYIASEEGWLRNRARIVSLLLHAGADPYLANNDGQRPIDVARGLAKRILERWLRSRERILANRLTVLPEAVVRDKIHPQIGHYHQYVTLCIRDEFATY